MYIITRKVKKGTQLGQVKYNTFAEAIARLNEMQAKGHKNLIIKEI